MKILITGACGNIGAHIVPALAQQGHEVRALDINAESLEKLSGENITLLAGDIADKDFVFKAVDGVDVILHLAWSFSDSLTELIDTDIKGYQHLLDAAVAFYVPHVINSTTAVAYGKPTREVVDETHPSLVEQARKPVYALAKKFTEDLSKVYAEMHEGLSVNTIMIWYAYGDQMGGKHLRSMIREAIVDGVIEVPAESGGSFLQLDDFTDGVLKLIEAKPKCELFNFGTIYLTWAELCELIVAQANPQATVSAIPKSEWKGGSFLAEAWNLSTQKAEDMIGYQTQLNREDAIKHLSKALESSVTRVKSEIAKG